MSPDRIYAEMIKKKADDIIYERIGTTVGSTSPHQLIIDGKTFWHVDLEADYPRIINDQSSHSVKFTVLHIGKVGHLLFDSEANLVEIPRRSSLDQKIEDELNRINNRISDLLLKEESNKFARLVTTRHLSSPLTNIITNVLFYKEYILPDIHTQLGQKIRKYAEILERRNFLTIEGLKIKTTSVLDEILTNTKSIDRTLELVLTDVISNESQFMHQISLLSPYIKVPTSYYDNALSVQSLVTLSTGDLWNTFSSSYPGYTARQQFRFPDWLRVLSSDDVQILNKTPDGYRGNSDVFEIMADRFADSGILPTMVI